MIQISEAEWDRIRQNRMEAIRLFKDLENALRAFSMSVVATGEELQKIGQILEKLKRNLNATD